MLVGQLFLAYDIFKFWSPAYFIVFKEVLFTKESYLCMFKVFFFLSVWPIFLLLGESIDHSSLVDFQEVANILSKGTKLREYTKGVENNVRQVELDSIQVRGFTTGSYLSWFNLLDETCKKDQEWKTQKGEWLRHNCISCMKHFQYGCRVESYECKQKLAELAYFEMTKLSVFL